MILTKLECAESIETIKYALASIFRTDRNPKGLNKPEIFDPLFHVIASAINVGDKKICSLGLDCLDILVKASPVERLQQNSSKLIGLLIRVCNYKYVPYNQKA
jgi:hypothetical protein